MAAIGDADAVICAVGARTGFNPKEFDEVDRKVGPCRYRGVKFPYSSIDA